MSSEIKVSSVSAKDGTAGISIADSTGAITANGGIANAGTISAGTLGDNIIHSVGWQHIETKVCPTDVDSVSFLGIFTDDYVAFDFEMAMEPASGSNNGDFFVQFIDNNNNAIDDTQYFSTLRWFPADTNDVQIARHTAATQGRLVYNVPNSAGDGGFRATMRVKNVSAPTLAGVDTDRDTYRHEINLTGCGFVESKYSYITNYVRHNGGRQEETTTGIKIFIRERGNFDQDHNFAAGSWITCFGIKGKST